MNYLRDTCGLSDFTNRQPLSKVVQWVESIAEDHLYLSAITIGEIQHGIERMPESGRKTRLMTWLNNDLIPRFNTRILPVDTPTMFLWGSLVAQMERTGSRMGVMDSLIIATAMQNNQIIVTRNISDFQPCGVQVINPWE